MFSYIIQNSYIIFLIIPLFYSACTTHKKVKCLLHTTITSTFGLCILIFVDSKDIGAWACVIMSILIFNQKLNLTQYISNISQNQILLRQDEEAIYKKFFPILSKSEFKFIIDRGKRINQRAKYIFTKQGEKFDKIYFFAKISEKKTIKSEGKNQFVTHIEEGDWVGVIDFLYYQKEEVDYDDQKWEETVKCVKDCIEIWYYEWDINTIRGIFFYANDNSLLNKLLLIWGKYICKSIEKLNSKVKDFEVEEMQNEDDVRQNFLGEVY